MHAPRAQSATVAVLANRCSLIMVLRISSVSDRIPQQAGDAYLSSQCVFILSLCIC